MENPLQIDQSNFSDDTVFFDVLLKKYCQFHGRARRKEYWMFFLYQFLIAIIGSLIIGIGLATTGANEKTVDVIFDWYGNIFAIAFLLPNLAVGVRRLHDIGKSGWLYFWGYLIAIGYQIPLSLPPLLSLFLSFPFVGKVFIAIIFIAICIVLLLWCVRDSQPGPNQYGQNPKEINN
jgi:uncharacterized membrane protein YhaH (DUF805 family)